MDTIEILLLILTVLLSIFFIILIAVGVGLLKIVSMVKKLIAKAELVVDNVEEATEVIRDAKGPLATYKVIRNIVKMTQKKGKK